MMGFISVFMTVIVLMSAFQMTLAANPLSAMNRIITENVTNKGEVLYLSQWQARYDQPNSPLVSTGSPNFIGVQTKIGCIATLDPADCGSPGRIGMSFWMRYKGFISDVLGDVPEYHQNVKTLIEQYTPVNFKWIKCFDSKEHGWEMSDFHSRCDNKGPTVSLFKVREDNIFGGFTTAHWGGTKGVKYADQGSLFSVKNVDQYNNGTLAEFSLDNKDKAIYNNPQLGPRFGEYDLFVHSKPHRDGATSSSLGSSYGASKSLTTEQKQTVLGGSSRFGLTHMEVFYMECFHPLEFLDTALSGSKTMDFANARLGTIGVNPGTFLKIDFDVKYLITGFAVQSTCSFFKLAYNDTSNQEQYYTERLQPKQFEPPVNKPVTFVLRTAISTSSSVKFEFSSQKDTCSFAVEMYGCHQECNAALGMENKLIKDVQISADGSKDENHFPKYSRANTFVGVGKGCWKAKDGTYLQIDLLVTKIITKIGIQSCYKETDHFPKTIKIAYCSDNNDFVFYNGFSFTAKTINTNHQKGLNITKLELTPPIITRKVRIYPTDKKEMRVELYGCTYSKNLDKSSVILSTGEAIKGRTMMMSVEKNSLKKDLLKAVVQQQTKKYETVHSLPINVSQWTKVFFSHVFGTHKSTKLFLGENSNAISLSSTIVSEKKVPEKMAVLDHPLDNADNVQLSDVMFFTGADGLRNRVQNYQDGPTTSFEDFPQHGNSRIPWENVTGWESHAGCTPSSNTGPCNNYLETGQSYLYLDASYQSVAELSSYYRVSGYKCFSFRYFMWGEDVGRLNVYLQDSSGKKELVWRLAGDQGDAWRTGRIPIEQARPFKVILEALNGNGYMGDIAIDQLYFKDTSLSFLPKRASPTLITGFTKSTVIGYNSNYMNSLTDALISAGMQKRFWTSCYKASSHTQSKFWSQCGGKGPTITIVRYKQYIFAAYSDRDWIDTAYNKSLVSSRAFILSLSNPSATMKQFKIQALFRYKAIKINKSQGPAFGNSLEINGLQVKSTLGVDYGGDSQSIAYLTGLSEFTADEVEVLHVSDHVCHEWCSHREWGCNNLNGQCICESDRLFAVCDNGQPQTFLGSYSESLHPNAFWDLNTFPIIYDLKTGKSSDVSSGAKSIEPGLTRKALIFSGTDNAFLGSYSDTCFAPATIGSGSMSIAFWLKYGNKTGGVSQTFFTFGQSSTSSLLQIVQSDSSKEELAVVLNFGLKKTTYSFAFPWNVWSHLVIVLAGKVDEPTVRVYRNGVPLQVSQLDDCSACVITDKTADVYIGEKINNLRSPNAYMDEIAMWCREISKQEVQNIFNFYKGQPGFLLYYMLKFSGKSWSDYKDFESPLFQQVQSEVTAKINSILPSPGTPKVTFECSDSSGELSCKVWFQTPSNNADFHRSFSNSDAFGSGVQVIAYSTTVVPSTWPTLQESNISSSAISVHWTIPEGDPYSIFQKYEIKWQDPNNASSLATVAEERYVKSLVLSNLMPYTDYNIHLTLWYLGGVSKTAPPITVTTAEIVPGPVLDLKILSAESNCLTIFWKEPASPIGGELRYYNLVYQQYAGGNLNTAKVDYLSGLTEYTHKLCNLKARTKYMIGVAAFTIGTGEYKTVNESTTAQGPTVSPRNVASYNATDPYDKTTTCFLNWTAPPEDTTNGNLTSYRIAATSLFTNKTSHTEIGACRTNVVLERLDVYNVYHVVVVAVSFKGFSPTSTQVYCFTEGTVPSAPPTNVTASGNSSSSCHVTWGPVRREFRNGAILGYNVTYLKFGAPLTELKNMITYGSSANVTGLFGLEIFTKYKVTVTAFTDKGSGNTSTVARTSCTTFEDVPDDQPSEFKVISKTKVNCSILWKGIDPLKANGIIKGYEAKLLDTNTTTSVGIYFVSCVNVTFKDLQPFHLYNISVLGFNSFAKSNTSHFECLTEQDVPLSPPPNLTCQAISSRILKVCWSEIPVIQRRGIVTSRTIHLTNVNETLEHNESTADPQCKEVDSLKEFTNYSIRIAAFTVGLSNFSETPVQCMTLEGVPKTAPESVIGNNVTAYSIWVKWSGLSVQPAGILRQWAIYYRVWNASEDTTSNFAVPVHQRNIVIGGLELFTLYCVQVAGMTVGPGVKSNCTYIITDSKWLPPPDGIPGFLKEKEKSTPTNCSITWARTTNSHPDPDGRVTGYKIFYTPEGTNATEVFEVPGENTTSFVMQNLEEFTKYKIQIAAFNIYGDGNKSDVMTCYTQEDVPSHAPVNVTGFNSSSTSIVINWEDMPTVDKNGIVREYRIIIFEVALGNSSAQVIIYKPGNRARRAITIDPYNQAITGLKKFTQYAIQIYGVTIGDGPVSPTLYVTTAEDVPTAPVTNLTVVNSSSSSLLFTWSNVPEANRHGIIRYFVLYYWLADWPIVEKKNVTVPIDSVRINPHGTSPEFKFDIQGLKIWTNYTVQVAGFTVGAGVPTNETTLSTDEDIPCQPPRVISFDIPQHTHLTVHWTEVIRTCRNGIIRGYKLIYQELPNSPPVTLNFTASERNYTLKNMNMDANYSVSVLAFTAKGDGNATFDHAPLDKIGFKSRPINVLAYNFTATTSIPVTWGAIPDPIVLDKIMGYRVSWRVLSIGDVEIEEAPWQYFTVRKDVHQAVIEGLENFVHCEVHVSGFSRGGKGPSGMSSGKTCRCNQRIATNYRIFPPYNSAQVSKDLKKVNMSGMIPQILNSLVVECCESCQSHGNSYLDFLLNGHMKPAHQQNENEVAELIDDKNDLSFPVYGWKWQVTYAERFRYIPLVESPGFAFLLREPDTDTPLKAVLKSTFATWPYILITVLMALIAGIVMWFLDTAYNPDDFPQTYLKGVANGWWWAFISMTTLGYGDKVPKSDISKLFAVCWVLTGLVVYGILSGSICSAFTSVIYQAKTELYGSSVSVIYNSPEYRFAVRRGAQVSTKTNYSNFDETLRALANGKVTGMLMDVYEAGTKSKEFKDSGNKLRIQKIFDFSSTYGVVLAGPSTKLYQCSRNWMSANRAEMIEHISKYMSVVETNEMNELVEITTGLFDHNSQVFKDFLNYSLMIYGGCFVLGIFYEIYYQTQKKRMEKLRASSPAYQLKEVLGTFTNDFITKFQSKLIQLRKQHYKDIRHLMRSKRNQRHTGSLDIIIS